MNKFVVFVMDKTLIGCFIIGVMFTIALDHQQVRGRGCNNHTVRPRAVAIIGPAKLWSS